MDIQPCATLLAVEIRQFHAFIQSDAAHLLFAALAGARVVIGYCKKSQYPEAHEIAAGLIIGSMLALVIAAEEAKVPSMVKHVFACKAPGSQEMLAVHKPAGARDAGRF